MRAYLPTTAREVAEFMENGVFDVAEIYAPTIKFLTSNSELNEEEVEFTLSMIAAEDAIELLSELPDIACVLAFEIPDEQISQHHEAHIELKLPLKWDQLECLFEISTDGEDLTWYARQEIQEQLKIWLN